MKIIILEDQKEELHQLIRLIEKWQAKANTQIQVHTFQSGEEFLQQYSSVSLAEITAFFLDIQLEKINGLDIAKRLRSDGYQGHILFLTAFREYVFEGYDVHALNYLLKPIKKESFFLCLDEIYKQFQRHAYLYRDKQKIVKIPYADIICFSSRLHYVDILTTTDCYLQYATLRQIIVNLPQEFLQVHRSYIVNLGHIYQISGSTIYLSNNKTVPIGRSYLNSVCKAFSDYVMRFD